MGFALTKIRKGRDRKKNGILDWFGRLEIRRTKKKKDQIQHRFQIDSPNLRWWE